jgi:hypothetical protein
MRARSTASSLPATCFSAALGPWTPGTRSTPNPECLVAWCHACLGAELTQHLIKQQFERNLQPYRSDTGFTLPVSVKLGVGIKHASHARLRADRTWPAADKIIYSRSLETISTPKARIERDLAAAAVGDQR